jgi:hypothetical protein
VSETKKPSANSAKVKQATDAQPELYSRSSKSTAGNKSSANKPLVKSPARLARIARQQQRQRQNNIITGTIVAVILITIASIIVLVIRSQATPLGNTEAQKDKSGCLVFKWDFPETPYSSQGLKVTGEPKDLGNCLRYIDIKVGTGAEVPENGTATVNYTGWLTDGTKFGTSLDSQPFQATLIKDSMIDGWIKGVPGMKVGGIRRLFIPPDLAYGSKGRQDDSGKDVIPANSTLIFDVEIVSVP